MADITIREARAEDAQALAWLNREEMGYGYPVDKTKEKLAMLLESGKDKILVAELDGTVAGYVHLNDYDVLYADHMKNHGHCRFLLLPPHGNRQEAAGCGGGLGQGNRRGGSAAGIRGEPHRGACLLPLLGIQRQ